MIIYCKIELRLPMTQSLKDKRSLLKSLQEKLRNKFNISLAEIGDKDLWGSSVLGIVAISDNNVYLEKQINKILDFIDNFYEAEIKEYSIEYF